MLSLRKEERIPSGLWAVPRVLSGNGKQRINPRYNKIFMVDPISDMLNRIKNAQSVKKETVEVPFSKICFEIGKILERTGFLSKVELKSKRTRRPIELTLKYEEDTAKVTGVKRISKPGKRLYVSVSQLGKASRKKGITIVSTSKGLMTAGEARAQGLGGEVLCEVW